MRPVRYLISTFAVVFLALLFAAAAGAQENATISGSVTDPTGAAIPNATVTVTQTATGVSRTAKSNGAGLFNFPGLQIGDYRLEVTAPGFKTYQKSGLVLNVGQTLVAKATLQVGSSSQTITVKASALQVQSQTNAITTLITGHQLRQLATNGRNVTELAVLGTGVTTNMPSFNGVTAQNANANIDFNGIRSDHNVWMIDGGEVYDRGSGGKLDVAISPDALAQFQILSSNYTPNFGIGSGATILMVLKSGTQHFHGGLWEVNRNDAFDAQNYFTKQAHQATPELRLNIWGGNLGGPVFIPHVYNDKRNKTFFFVNEEWRRLIQGANPSVVNTIPTPFIPTAGQPLAYKPLSGNPLIVPMTQDPNKLALYQADGLTAGQPFTQNSNGDYVIPANLLDPNAVLFMNTGAIPKANFNNGTQVISSPKQPTSVREDVVRIDEHFNDKYQLMGHWVHDQMSQTIFPVQWSGDSYNTVGDVFANPSWSAVIKLTQALSPSMLNVTSLDTNGNTINVTPTGIFQEPDGWTAKGIFSGNNALNRMPQIAFSGAPNTTYSVIYWPWHNSYLNYQLRDDLSVTKGKHDMKFGFSYMREDKNQQLQADTQGDYTFADSAYSHDAYANFLLGFASSYDQLQNLSTAHWVDNTYSFYLMDNWHVSPRLTLNLGIRYDAMPHTYEKNGQDSNFVPSSFSMRNAQVPSETNGSLDPNGPGFQFVPGTSVPFYLNGMELAGITGPRGLVNNWYKAVQPRVGFAYDLTGNGTTVLRSGAGIFFERVQGNDIYGTAVNPPYAYQPSVSGVYFSNPNVNNQTGAQASTPFFPGSLTGLNKYYPNPGTLQYSIGIQHQFAPSVVAKLQYVGSSTWHQNYERAINTLPLMNHADPSAPFGDREAVANGANSNLFRMFPGWSGITLESNGTNTSYNSLQAGIRMQNKHGLTVQFAYTWSHEIDILSADVGGNEVGGAQLSDPFNISYDKGSGTIDRRNVFNVNYIYNLPFFAHSSSRMTRALLGGWTLSGITVAESGSPVNVTYSPDDLGLGGGTTNRPNITSKVSYPKTQKAWFSASSFSAPVAPWDGGPNQGFGTARKDSVIGPGLFNWDMSLFKSFHITEGTQIELRAESYNTFNHTEFNGIDTGFTDPNFGQVTSAQDPRTFQFGGKFSF